MAKSSPEQTSRATLFLALQEIDLELSRIHELLEHPSEVQKLKKTYAMVKKIDAQLTMLKGKRKDIEMAIDDLDSEQRSMKTAIEELKDKAQSSSTDYRSQAALRDQYASLAKRLEKSEFTSDATMEKLGILEDQEKRLVKAKNLAAQEVNVATQAARAQVSALQKEMAQLEARRDRLAHELDAASLRSYETALKRYNGLAVEVLQGAHPSVCRVSLTTAALEDAQRHGPVTQCPYCKRILVVSEEESR